LTIDEKEKRRMEGKKLQKKERNILRREMKSMDPKKYSFFLLKLIFFLKKILMTGCSRLYKEVYWWTFFGRSMLGGTQTHIIILPSTNLSLYNIHWREEEGKK